ncbi:MAG: preprotein translocase subunit YajC [Heliobacteriaceae bacterium]|nr:preprotein translocase subunit YajC [Heliobacteriaceae bacterium]MDD4587110.1 preprotein translocase subunit YajC [Heliobacteriaceae bacterium]
MPQGWESLISLGLLLAVLYFIMIRPQLKAQKAHHELLAKLEANDKVMTAGGLYGTLTKIDGDKVTMKIADDVKVVFAKSAIKRVIMDD